MSQYVALLADWHANSSIDQPEVKLSVHDWQVHLQKRFVLGRLCNNNNNTRLALWFSGKADALWLEGNGFDSYYRIALKRFWTKIADNFGRNTKQRVTYNIIF